jgi:serine protease AprX
MSVPADSYNSIVVANMNTTLSKTEHSLTKTADRSQHVITASSSRGPTLSGRKKPDLTSPGNDTRTCAPDPSVYAVEENPTFHPYGISMQYHQDSQTRLAGGTSMATPHVGGASALLYSAGIHAPAAIKSLLINSADTWTDNDQPGPGDTQHPCDSSLPMCGHGQKAGSQWNRTYGWGYINMDNAYQQKDNIIKLDLSPNNPMCFQGKSRLGSKITVAWNRRFGFTKNKLWPFTPINMMLFSVERKILLDEDLSRIDNVIQVSNYPREKEKNDYFNEDVILKVYVPNDVVKIDGGDSETAYLTSEKNLKQVDCPDWLIN